MNYANLNIQAMRPYQPPEESRLNFSGRLLDFNEKTLPPSPAIQAALRSVIENNIIQIYPEECLELRERIAAYTGVEPNQVLLTNGSDQAIDIIFRTFTSANSEVIIPMPTYSLYMLFAELAQTKIITPTYNPDLTFPFENIQRAVTTNTKLIIVCNPNNPTGTLASLNEIEALARKNSQSMVYVDEAYVEFSHRSAVPLLTRYPNIVISRTFSKAFGLAGLRIGYVLASEPNSTVMAKVRNPYDINIFAYYGARAALDSVDELNAYVDEVMNQSKPRVEAFFQTNGIEYFPSAANFILFRPNQPASQVFEKLRDSKILIRPRQGPYIKNTIRLTIGTVDQMEASMAAYTYKILNHSYE